MLPGAFEDAALDGSGGAPETQYFGGLAVGPRQGDPAAQLLDRYSVRSDPAQTVAFAAIRASALKPTFLQVTDMAQFGTLEEVRAVVLPRRGQLLSSEVRRVDLAERDTGTIVGRFQPPATATWSAVWALRYRCGVSLRCEMPQ